MTSQINPNNIDGAYPVAGQDNNSQGFRDNFTNTKTNFIYASQEITDLQNKVVLKAALTGTSLDNDMQGSILSNAQLQDMSETRVPLGSQTGTVTLDYSAGPFQTLTTTGSITLGFSNFPAAGAVATLAVQITLGSTAHTVTLPAAVSVNTAGVQGLNTTGNIMTFAVAGVYTLVFSTGDGGTTITLNQANNALLPFNNTSEDLANGAAASLAKTASYFTTGGAETATLAAGVEGQIKTFMMVASAGNMVITVTNAGWKASGTGTITVATIGQGCTLQYINSKWYVIGNNGCVFA